MKLAKKRSFSGISSDLRVYQSGTEVRPTEIFRRVKVAFFKYSHRIVNTWPSFGVLRDFWNIVKRPNTCRSYEFVAGRKLSRSCAREALWSGYQREPSFTKSTLEVAAVFG